MPQFPDGLRETARSLATVTLITKRHCSTDPSRIACSRVNLVSDAQEVSVHSQRSTKLSASVPRSARSEPTAFTSSISRTLGLELTEIVYTSGRDKARPLSAPPRWSRRSWPGRGPWRSREEAFGRDPSWRRRNPIVGSRRLDAFQGAGTCAWHPCPSRR